MTKPPASGHWSTTRLAVWQYNYCFSTFNLKGQRKGAFGGRVAPCAFPRLGEAAFPPKSTRWKLLPLAFPLATAAGFAIDPSPRAKSISSIYPTPESCYLKILSPKALPDTPYMQRRSSFGQRGKFTRRCAHSPPALRVSARGCAPGMCARRPRAPGRLFRSRGCVEKGVWN